MRIKLVHLLVILLRRSPCLYGGLLVILLSILFAIRNIPAFTFANFYAEDATVLYENIYTKGFLDAVLSAFNGYLIVGQYLLAYVAAGLNFVIGNNLETLPISTAIVSCVFLGLVASLPFILFREQLGARLAILASLLTALIPLKSFDYAIIGTISNLKFIFLYVAVLLVIYRLTRKDLSTKRIILIDATLLLCALTNVTVALLLPLILLPHVTQWLSAVRTLNWHSVLSRNKYRQISGIILVALAAAYTLIALLKGIPKIPGYLEGPFLWESTLPLIDRSLFFSLMYPVTSSFNDYFVGALFLVTISILAWQFVKKQDSRYIIAVALWAIFLGTVLFAINRPGIGVYYLNYDHKGGPDQFFMAQNMIFIFLIAWLIKDSVRRFNTTRYVLLSVAVTIYLLLALPHGSSFGASRVVYEQMGPIGPNIDKACAQYSDEDKVIIQVYPTPYWQWHVDHDLACE